MKILITGSAGFIGGGLLECFSQDGHSLTATYRNTKPHLLLEGTPNIDFVQLDLAESQGGLGPADVIIHAAAHTHLVPDSTASDYIKSNGIGMLNLVNYARRVRPKLFIFLSTLSVYGEIETDVLTEDTPLNKPGMYGLTKYTGELILKEMADYFPSICLRLPGVVGAGYFMPWIGKVFQKIVANEPIQLYNPASCFNNIVDITELYRFVSWVIDKEIEGSEAYNLAASMPVSIREIIDLMISLTDSSSKISEQETSRQSFSISTSKIEEAFEFKTLDTISIVRRYVANNLS